MNWTPERLRRGVARAATITTLAGALSGIGFGVTAGVAHADPTNDGCSTRSGCYHGPGSRWCPGDYVWPGLVATGWDLSVCHVYHEDCPPSVGACPDSVAEGPPPPTPPAIISTREQCEQILGIFCPKA